MNRDRSFRLLQARTDTALHHERGEKSWGAGDTVLAVDQYPFAFVRLFLQPNQSFLHMLGMDDSCVGGRNPPVQLAGMFRRLVSSGWPVSVGAANVEDCRDLLWIVADEFVCVLLTAEPQVINDVVHHDCLSSPLTEKSPHNNTHLVYTPDYANNHIMNEDPGARRIIRVHLLA